MYYVIAWTSNHLTGAGEVDEDPMAASKNASHKWLVFIEVVTQPAPLKPTMI